MERPGPPAGTSAADATTGSTVLYGGLWNGLSTLLPPLYVLAQSVAAARFLGPERLGVQTYIAWAALSLAMLLGVGMSRALSRYVATLLGSGDPGSVRTLVRWGWRVQIAAAVVGGGVLLTVAAASDEQALAWTLVAGVCVLSVLQTVPASVLIGLQEWRRYSVIGLATGVVGTAATVVVLALGGGIAGMFAVELVVVLVNLSWAKVLADRALPGGSAEAAFRSTRWRREVGGFAALATVQALLTLIVWRRSEVFFLDLFASTTEIAHYSIAFGIAFAVQQLPGGLVGALIPAIATLLGAGQTDRIRAGVGRALRLALLLSLPLTAGLLAVGPRLVSVVYGADYAAAGTALRVFVVVLPLVTVALVAGGVLQAYGRIRAMIWTAVVATVVDLGLVLLLVPSSGALGAAVANTTAQGTLAGLRLWVAIRTVGGTEWALPAVGRATVAAVLAGVCGWLPVLALTGAVGLGIGVLAGLLVFALVAVPLRVIPPADAAWLREAAGDRLGGLVGRVCDRFAPAPSSR